MMTVLDQVTRRRAVQSFFFILLLIFFSYALASNSPISGNGKSRRCSPDVKEAHDRMERKLAAVPAPEPAVSGNASAPRPSNPRPPTPPPDSRPALISPSDDAPGTDLPPRILPPSPAPEAPITSPIHASKKSNVAVIVGVASGVLVFLLVSLSAAAYLKPEWLPCCTPRRSESIQYERHVST